MSGLSPMIIPGFGSWSHVTMMPTWGIGAWSYSTSAGPLIIQAVQIDASGVYALSIDSNGCVQSQSVAIGPEQALPVVNTSSFG